MVYRSLGNGADEQISNERVVSAASRRFHGSGACTVPPAVSSVCGCARGQKGKLCGSLSPDITLPRKIVLYVPIKLHRIPNT